MKDEIPIIESYNAKAISCISEVFNKISISSNIIFWLCMIVIMFLISMVIAMILYGNKEIRKIFTSNDINDNDISDLKMTVSSKSNKKEEYDNKIDKKKEVFKSAVFGNKKVKTVFPNVGLEQEYFLIDRDLFLKRPDECGSGKNAVHIQPKHTASVVCIC